MTTIQIRGKGGITLPASLRKKYDLEEGDVYTIIDLGEGTFLLKPKALEMDKLSQRAARTLREDNVSLEEIFETLDRERRRYFNEKYGRKK